MKPHRSSHHIRLAMLLLGSLTVSYAQATTSRVHAQTGPVQVDAAELKRRNDLVGKLLTIDDRVRFYQFHPGRGYDELYLKRTDVVFRLPPGLRPESAPRPSPVIVEGSLVRHEGQLIFDVTSLRSLPPDLDRVNQAVAALGARDFENRKVWAAWALKRGKDFSENALIHRSQDLEAEALRIEGEMKRVNVDAPGEWLALAEDARRRKVVEPEPSALGHKAYKAMLAAAEDSRKLKDVLGGIETFFPQAGKDVAASKVNLATWEAPYTADPAATYRTASEEVRKALDRRLWASAKRKLLEQQATEDPAAAIGLATTAESELPEFPELAEGLLTSGLETARRNLGNLRRDELRSLGTLYKEKLRNPQGALDLYKGWLKIQRDRLSETDADGLIDLADLYEQLLTDRTTAKDLLEKAWKINPASPVITEAFRSRGYHRMNNQWVEASAPAGKENAGDGTDGNQPNALSIRGLRGKSPEEVIQELGSKPDRRVFSGTNGQLIEQWIFQVPLRNNVRFVNFLKAPGDQRPRVVSDYTLPRSAIEGSLKPGE